jgi:2-methylcitrate dehydratase PrpD
MAAVGDGVRKVFAVVPARDGSGDRDRPAGGNTYKAPARAGRAMTDDTPEARLAAFAADCSVEDLPEEAVETVERAFVDTVGVALAGAVEDAGERTRGFAAAGDDPAALAGRALAYGSAAHALDYDDLAWAMDGHPSVVLVPPILALAEATDADGADAVAAYAAGFETACAVAGPLSPGHYERGWHATATFGAFGATAAAANLLGLDAETTRRALSTAASTPAGTKRNFGSMTKPVHAGLASRSGVTAALLAREGVTADARAVSGETGFWDLYGGDDDDPDPESVAVGDGLELVDSGIDAKAYPCCYFTHSSVAAAGDIREGGVDPDEVESVRVVASPGARDALQHADPGTGLEAKFSMEYCVASALVRDRVGLATFEEPALSDSTVDRVRSVVDFRVDEDLAYDAHDTTVTVETATATRERSREKPPGTHDDPLSESAYRRKFRSCATRVVDEERAEAAYDRLSALREAPSLAPVVELFPS